MEEGSHGEGLLGVSNIQCDHEQQKHRCRCEL